MTRLRYWRIPGGELLSLANARREFRDCLRSIATESSDLLGSEVIFGELASNGLEHGKGDVTMTLWREGTTLVLSASDDGGWSPGALRSVLPEPLAERGRGLFFVDALGRRLVDSCSLVKEIRVVLPARVG